MRIANATTSQSLLSQIAKASLKELSRITLGKSTLNPKSLTWLQNAGGSIATALKGTQHSSVISTVNAEEGANIANTIIGLIKSNAADEFGNALANGIAYLTHGFSIEGKVHKALLNFTPNAANSHDLVSVQLQDPYGHYMPTVSRPGDRNSHPAMPIPQVNGRPDTTNHRFWQEGSNYQAAQHPNVPPAPPPFPKSSPLQQAAYSPYANIPARSLLQSQPTVVLQTSPPVAAPNRQVPIPRLDEWLNAQEHPKSPPSASPRSPRLPPTAQPQPPMLSSRTANSTPLVDNPALAIARMNDRLDPKSRQVVAHGVEEVNTYLNSSKAVRASSRQQPPNTLGRTPPAAYGPLQRRGDPPVSG